MLRRGMTSGAPAAQRRGPRLRDRAVAGVFIVCFMAGIVAVTVWFFGAALPSMDDSVESAVWSGNTPLRLDLEQPVPRASVEKSVGYRCLEAGWICAAAALALWCLYRLFIYFGNDLDEIGRWNQAISERHPRYRPYLLCDAAPAQVHGHRSRHGRRRGRRRSFSQ